MATCTSGQLPYHVDYSGANFDGNTPAEACQKNGIAYNGYYAVLNNGTYCEVGWSGSGDGHNIIHQCDAAVTDTTTPDPSTTVTCTSACTITVVHELSLPPLQLSPADGAAIASAVLAVWALGWGIRQVIRVLKSDGDSTSESET